MTLREAAIKHAKQQYIMAYSDELAEYVVVDFEAGYDYAQEEDKWISIDDRTKKLPDGDFLVLFDNGEVRRYFEKDHPLALFTHWQPLPKPPVK